MRNIVSKIMHKNSSFISLRTHITKISLLLSFAILSACSHTGNDQPMDGLLIKESAVHSLEGQPTQWVAKLNLPESAQLKPALNLYLSGKQQEALGELRKALQHQPYHQGALALMATIYADMLNLDMAGFFAKKLQRLNPQNAVALNVLGLKSYHEARALSDYRRSQQFFEQAFIANNQEVAAGLNLGYLLLEVGQPQKAEGVFSKVMTRCRNCKEGRYGFALSSKRLGKNGVAKRIFEDLIKQDPQHFAANYQLALHYLFVAEEPAEAADLLSKMVSLPEAQETATMEKIQQLLRASSNNPTQL